MGKGDWRKLGRKMRETEKKRSEDTRKLIAENEKESSVKKRKIK